jgi:pimeloyl-ACP methyl ester carboxylesterase
MLFIYGTKKPFMFHTKEWAEQLDRRPGGKVLAMKTDHWPMRSAPNEFNQAVLGWLTASATATSSH